MNNKLAIIIGVGPGLGLSLAKTFYKEGFDICMIARNIDKLESYINQVKIGPGKISCYGVDVSNRKSLESTLRIILQVHGIPDLVIYNVSILRTGNPSQIDYELFIDDFKINVAGILVTYQSIFPAMKKKGSGTIIITGGGLALSPYMEMASLGVGKAGIRNLAGSLAQEVEGSGIRLYTITINGMIQEGTKFDPTLISDKFLEVFNKGLANSEYEFILQ